MDEKSNEDAVVTSLKDNTTRRGPWHGNELDCDWYKQAILDEGDPDDHDDPRDRASSKKRKKDSIVKEEEGDADDEELEKRKTDRLVKKADEDDVGDDDLDDDEGSKRLLQEIQMWLKDEVIGCNARAGLMKKYAQTFYNDGWHYKDFIVKNHARLIQACANDYASWMKPTHRMVFLSYLHKKE